MLLKRRSEKKYPFDPNGGRVYRVHVTGGYNNLSMLICVFSGEPGETIQNYVKHASVKVLSEPVLIDHMNASSKGIDVYIGAKKDAPYYEIVNTRKIHPIHRGFVEADR